MAVFAVMSEIPYAPGDSPPHPLAQPRRPLVLVLESHEDARELLKTLLELSGYEVVQAHDGAQALAMAEHRQPALILMNAQVPGQDGLALMAQLRGHQLLKGVPIIATASNPAPAFRGAALAAGCNELLVKPVPFAYLEGLLKKHLTEQ